MKYRQTYDPALGRFGQEDRYDGSLETPSEKNFYVYTRNSPITNTDPLGLFCIPWSTGPWQTTKTEYGGWSFGGVFLSVWVHCLWTRDIWNEYRRELKMMCCNYCSDPPCRIATGYEIEGRISTDPKWTYGKIASDGFIWCSTPDGGLFNTGERHPGHAAEY
jgi:hypothetical protein